MKVKKKVKKAKPKQLHISIRAMIYGCVSSIFVAILCYICKGIWEPHEAIKFVEFATVSMLIAEHVI